MNRLPGLVAMRIMLLRTISLVCAEEGQKYAAYVMQVVAATARGCSPQTKQKQHICEECAAPVGTDATPSRDTAAPGTGPGWDHAKYSSTVTKSAI